MKVYSLFRSPTRLSWILALWLAVPLASHAEEPAEKKTQLEQREPVEKETPEEDAEEKKAEKKGEPESEEEEAEEQPEFDAEAQKERSKRAQENEKKNVDRMMKVFKPLEGEWVGKESTTYLDERFSELNRSWDDEWKGFYTMDGRYFEMTGRATGDAPSNYKWVCTWDDEKEYYRAWYFGDTGFNRYVGLLSDDKTIVVWTRQHEDGAVSEFLMRATGDKVRCESKEALPGGRPLSKGESNYTRKKLEI